ncbi:type IX secretion system protein PorG [Algoriphagus chordae]|uniref:DUF6089 domain-containing protein n=1 Tax=Algoriphagus chordae TaxID=237019 RepID=A0A2W7QXG9_9BACT|nr:DUF6089 family protein [Algoriphagus chordae]PZX52631.1 hypothetical protein LV85_01933 [Algoriphagus chordae]
MRFFNVRYFISCIVLKKVNFQIFNYLLVFSLLFLGISSELRAQKYDIGGGLGVAAYSGDIIRKIDPGQLGPQGTLFGRRNFDNVWALRVAVSAGILYGADSIKPIDQLAKIRDGRFRAGIVEASAIMEFNFLDYLTTNSEFRFSPYAFFGIGYTFAFAKGNTYAFNPSTRYDLGTLVIPFGGGVKYQLDERWTLAAELGFRPTFTDYLDKIDSTEPIIPRFQDPSNPTAAYGINFGNAYDKDWYYFLGVTISYTLMTTKCYAY